MKTFHVKNLERFQHYKDRAPPWIKLYNELLDDYEFGLLPDASKWHLIAIWLLASRSANKIPYDATWVGRRINAASKVDLDLLVRSGFIVIDQELHNAEQDASEMLAECLPRERGRDRGETEGETDVRAVASATRPDAEEIFEKEFWPAYPKRGSAANPKKPAKDKFVRLARDGVDPRLMVDAAKRFCAIEREAGRHGSEKVAQAITWLNQQRFNDYAESVPARPTGPPAPGLPSDEELRRKYGAANGSEGRPRGAVADLAQQDHEPGGAEVLRAGTGVHPGAQFGIRDRAGNAGMRSVGQILSAHRLGADRLPRDDGAIQGGSDEIDDGTGPVAGVV